MKIDFNYIKYRIRSFVISDFESREISSLLNDLEPEEYLKNYILSLDLNKENSNTVTLRLRSILEKAKKDHVPLSINYEQYENGQNAYLARQRYINVLVQKMQFLAFIRKSILLLTIAAISLLILLISNS